MSNFRDINGKPIVPGSKVVVATSSGRYHRHPALRQGVVYRTSIRVGYDGRPSSRGTIGVIVDVPFDGIAQAGDEVKMTKSKRSFRAGGNILVIG